MTDKEKRELKDSVINIFNKFNIFDNTVTIGGLRDDILRYINSLPKEPISKDLEEAAYHNCIDRLSNESIEDFKAGANWQKEQMMAKAIDGKVIANGMGNPILHLWDKGKHLIDKKVKVILINED